MPTPDGAAMVNGSLAGVQALGALADAPHLKHLALHLIGGLASVPALPHPRTNNPQTADPDGCTPISQQTSEVCLAVRRPSFPGSPQCPHEWPVRFHSSVGGFLSFVPRFCHVGVGAGVPCQALPGAGRRRHGPRPPEGRPRPVPVDPAAREQLPRGGAGRLAPP